MSYEHPVRTATKDLQLGDVVQVFVGPWGTGIISNITDTEITIWRPYGHCGDFATKRGVICYTGLEEFTRPKDSLQVWLVYEHNVVR